MVAHEETQIGFQGMNGVSRDRMCSETFSKTA